MVVKRFQSELEKNLAESKKDEDSIDVKYSKLVKHIKEAAEDHFQPDQGSQRRRKEWMTDEILEVIEKKFLSFLAWQNYRGTPAENKARRQYVALRKLVKNMVDRRQTEYWDEVSLEIETAIQQHDPATAFATIRRLSGGKQRVDNMPLRDKTGTLLVNSSDKTERWKEYFQQLLNVDSAVDQTLIDQIQPAHISVQEARR